MSKLEIKIKAIELAIPKVVNSLNPDELIKNAQKIYEFLTATDVPSNSSLSS